MQQPFLVLTLLFILVCALGMISAILQEVKRP